ncbi:hypothetical protein Tco_0912295 [Tanacetum coccineum]
MLWIDLSEIDIPSHISRSIPSSLHGSHNPKSSPFPAVNLGCYKLVSEALWYRELGCIREMSQSLSSNVPDNSPEQEAATGHSNLRRLGSPTSQAIQLPELELTLTPATRREHSQEINNLSVPALISQAPGPSRKRSRSPSSPFLPDAITFSNGQILNPEDVTARLEDLKDSLAAAENEIAILQMRVADTEGS